MSRRVVFRRTAEVAAVLSALALLPGAIAGPATPGPVIDSAPNRVAFRAPFEVRGHVEGGSEGDSVVLERLEGDGAWRPVATRALLADGTVSFPVERVRTSAAYRMYWHNRTTAQQGLSDEIRIDVTPALGMHLRPGDVFRGDQVRVAGFLYPKVERERWVLIEQWVDGGWKRLGRVEIENGRFTAAFTPTYSSQRAVRATFIGGELNTPARATQGLNVYDAELATWYGPGFYGNTTACGQRLDYDTLGVAHRTLPCGTKVSILYQGRSINVQVIDRGPYSSANWDLTGATARRLGFSGKENIGVAF
jgi:rare lipoprotein A